MTTKNKSERASKATKATTRTKVVKGRAVCRSRPDAAAESGWHEEWYAGETHEPWTTDKNKRLLLTGAQAHRVKKEQSLRAGFTGEPLVVRVLRVSSVLP